MLQNKSRNTKLQRITALCLTVIMTFLLVSMPRTMYALNTNEWITFTNQEGKQVKSIKSGDTIVGQLVDKDKYEGKNPVVIMALYDEDSMKALSKVQLDEIDQKGLKLQIPEDISEEAFVKAMIWNSIDEMQPLEKALILSTKEEGEEDDLDDYDIPENIRADKAAFDTIGEVIKKYEEMYPAGDEYGAGATAYVDRVNGEHRIQRINFIQYKEGNYENINGSKIYDLPTDIARVLRLFGDIRIEGSIADSGVKLFIIDPNGNEQECTIITGHKWTDRFTQEWTTYTKTEWMSEKNHTITQPWNVKDENGNIVYDNYKLKIVGTGTLRSIYIWEENGMPLDFDISAWTVLGKDKDILDVTVEADATKNLSINGINKLDEEVFKRYHVNSGPVGLESIDGNITYLDKAYHKTVQDWGFIPGRGAFHFSLLTKYSGLVEDSNRPGYADFTEVNKIYAKNQAVIDKFNNLYPTIGKDYVLTLDGWPRWMWEDPDSTKMQENFATPALKHFDAAADAAAKLIKAIDTRFDGLGPKYVEVKNESTISSEWDFFNSNPSKAWDYLADFHNKVADTIKAENPDVLVGGPSSAFMYLEKGDFDEARAQLKFMDDTKEHLDWYSHHFYENSNTLFINDNADNSDGFLAGRLEAVLDLLNAHMVNTDNVKPILITEEGTYNSGPTDIDYFKKFVAFNGYMLRFMDYPDSIDMIVPYLYPIINWRPDSNDTFYKHNAAKNDIIEEMTPLEAYLDMWKDYKGAFIPTEADNDRVFTKAVSHGDKIYIAVDNFNSQRVNLDLNVITEGASIKEVSRKHFYLEKGKLTYEEEKVNNLDDIFMRAQEMSMFEITLSNAPRFESTLLRKVDYAKEELLKTSETAPAEFTIQDVDTNNLVKSTLRIGFGKEGKGFTQDMAVMLNDGITFNKDLEYTNKSGDILTYVEFDISNSDLSKIKKDNIIKVSIPENGGYITSVQLFNYYDDGIAPVGKDTTELKAYIDKANEKLQTAVISETGIDVKEGQKWVIPQIHGTLSIAIRKANDVYKDILATKDEINAAKEEINLAMDIFENNKKDPILSGIDFEKISFEEDIDYKIPESTRAEIVTNQGVTDGNSAIKYTIDTPSTGFWTYKQLTVDSSHIAGWDISKDGIKFDITNPNDYKIQARIYLYDIDGKSGFIWKDIESNTTVTVHLNDFSPRADWTKESYGYSKGINAKNIMKIGICFNEEDPNFKPGTSMIIDNIR